MVWDDRNVGRCIPRVVMAGPSRFRRQPTKLLMTTPQRSSIWAPCCGQRQDLWHDASAAKRFFGTAAKGTNLVDHDDRRESVRLKIRALQEELPVIVDEILAFHESAGSSTTSNNWLREKWEQALRCEQHRDIFQGQAVRFPREVANISLGASLLSAGSDLFAPASEQTPRISSSPSPDMNSWDVIGPPATGLDARNDYTQSSPRDSTGSPAVSSSLEYQKSPESCSDIIGRLISQEVYNAQVPNDSANAVSSSVDRDQSGNTREVVNEKMIDEFVKTMEIQPNNSLVSIEKDVSTRVDSQESAEPSLEETPCGSSGNGASIGTSNGNVDDWSPQLAKVENEAVTLSVALLRLLNAEHWRSFLNRFNEIDENPDDKQDSNAALEDDQLRTSAETGTSGALSLSLRDGDGSDSSRNMLNDSANTLIKSMQDFLMDSHLSTFDFNSVLARVALSPELSPDDVLEYILQFYSQMEKLATDGFTEARPNATTYEIILLTLHHRLLTSGNAVDIIKSSMVSNPSCWTSNTLDAAMLVLRKVHATKLAARLFDDIQTEGQAEIDVFKRTYRSLIYLAQFDDNRKQGVAVLEHALRVSKRKSALRLIRQVCSI